MGYIGSGPTKFNTADGLTVTGDAEIGDDLLLNSDSAVLSVGADADLKITHDGTNGDFESAGNLTFDVAGDITLDADGGDVLFKDDGTAVGYLSNSSTDLILGVSTSDKDLYIQGNDGGPTINALHLDMSAAGLATFNAGASFAGTVGIGTTSVTTGQMEVAGGIYLSGSSNFVRFGADSSTPTGVAIHRPASNVLGFVTASTEFMRIASTGKVETSNRDFGFINHGTSVSLADDATIIINGSTGGVGLLAIYDTASGANAVYRAGYLNCEILSNSASNFAAADTDGKICVFSNQHTITIKNRLGATKSFFINMFMAGNNFAG